MNASLEARGVRGMLVTAGFGTRLVPLTDLLPKPAVPVANRPLAWFALDHLYRAGVRELALNTHHLAAELEREIGPWAPDDLRLRFVFEPQILGTGGGIRNAWGQPQPGETFVAMSGKYVFAPDLDAALRAHHEARALVTMVLTDAPGMPGFGAVEIDSEGWVRRLRRTPLRATGEPALRPMFYTGISIFSERAFELLPENGDLISEGYQHWIARGEPVLGAIDPNLCLDAGISLWHYWEANQALWTGRVRWPGIAPDPDGVICEPDVECADDVALARCSIGSKVRLAPGIRVEDSVIWPRADLRADAVRCIVLPDGRQLAISSRPPSDTRAP